MIGPELRLVDYIHDTRFADLPAEAVTTVRRMLLADLGTTVAGARADGCPELVDFHRRQGGATEATLLVHGGRVPAQHAAFVNAAMSRALDFCDAIAPGPHIGSAVIPTALACAELAGGCDGETFLAALAVGTEIAARFNLGEAAYDGFDPTGICVPLGATATACRLLGLDAGQTRAALGAAFNRCGGSFQSHVDGSLGVRVNQGWVAHDALLAARFALLGIGGAVNFLTGIYGYLHLYGKGTCSADDVVDGLGDDYRLRDVVFKKYPSCALTASPTEATAGIVAEHRIGAADVARVEVVLPPYAHRLVGQPFKIGDNPTVDGQFSAAYCVANVLLRGGSKIAHFVPAAVREPPLGELAGRVVVTADPRLERRGHTAADVTVTTVDGRQLRRAIDIAPGFPGNPLDDSDHRERFEACVAYAAAWFPGERAAPLLAAVERLESCADVTVLVELLTVG